MFKDLEQVSLHYASEDDDSAMQYYLMTLSSAICKASFIEAESIIVDPLPLGASITINTRQGDYSYCIYSITPRSTIFHYIKDESEDPLVARIIEKCRAIDYLVYDFYSASACEVVLSTTYDLKKHIKEMLAEGADEWYLSDFLKMPLLSRSIENDDVNCLVCMTPIGPITGLAYMVEDELTRGLAYIHLINTSLHLERKGLASKLYHKLSQFCLENDFWLCRGEPSANTSIQGYEDRGRWLKENYPKMGVVEHQNRKMIRDLIQNNLSFSQPGSHELIPYLKGIIKAYTEGPGGQEIGEEQAMSALSYMSAGEIKGWRSPWA